MENPQFTPPWQHKHRGKPLLSPFTTMSKEGTAALCTENTDGVPCPFHEPMHYARSAAKHRGATHG